MRLDTDLALKAGKYLASLWENISLLVVAGFCQCLSCCVNIIRVNISKNHHLSWQQVIMGLNMRKKLTHWTWHYRADWTNGFQEWEGSIFEGDGDNVATFMANFTLFKAPVLLLEASIDPIMDLIIIGPPFWVEFWSTFPFPKITSATQLKSISE